MTKLKFDSLSSGFKFKLVEKKRKPRTESNKRLTKLVRGVCIKENDDYKIALDIKHLKPNILDSKNPDILVLNFTEESYNLRGVTSVFSREKNEIGHYTRYIRNESYCKCFPGDPERLVPFCHNWVCSGYIVKRSGKLIFEFNECIAPQGYAVAEIEDED